MVFELHFVPSAWQKVKKQEWRARDYRSPWTVRCYCSSIIGTGHSLGKITFMSLTSSVSQKVSCRGLSSLFPFRLVSFSTTVLVLCQSFSIHGFGAGSSFFQIAPFILCTPLSQSRSFLWQYIVLKNMLVVFLRTFRRWRPPTQFLSPNASYKVIKILKQQGKEIMHRGLPCVAWVSVSTPQMSK
jgi:hypothetical protein